MPSRRGGGEVGGEGEGEEVRGDTDRSLSGSDKGNAGAGVGGAAAPRSLGQSVAESPSQTPVLRQV